MQLLETTNNLLATSSAGGGGSGARRLRTQNYAVVPLSAQAGLVEWVPRAVPLFQVYRRWQRRDAQSRAAAEAERAAYEQQQQQQQKQKQQGQGQGEHKGTGGQPPQVQHQPPPLGMNQEPPLAAAAAAAAASLPPAILPEAGSAERTCLVALLRWIAEGGEGWRRPQDLAILYRSAPAVRGAIKVRQTTHGPR